MALPLYKIILWERGCTSCIGNYLILLNKVNSKGAVRYRRERRGRCGVSNCGIGYKVRLSEEPLSYLARQLSTLTERWTGYPKEKRS
jgi:hypothetical protein